MRQRHRAPKRYDGQVAVVTGASSGIGRRVAIDLAARGATVVGVARRRELLDALLPRLREHSAASAVEACDVSELERLTALLEDVEERIGPIDILINNAGVDLMLSATTGTPSTVHTQFDINFYGPVTATLLVLPRMVERRSGIVVNVSSDSARAPEPGQAAYAASKAALATFTESLALEVAGAGVHLHVLYPGWVPTAMGLSGEEDGGSLPPRMVRRTEEQVSSLLLERMGEERIDINAAALPLMAPISKLIAPVLYQRAMRRMATTGKPLPK
jgi:short-subunit dehydrogenase